MERKKKLDKDKVIAAASLAVTAGFLIAIYAPFEQYFTNWDELWFDFRTVIGTELVYFFALTAVIFFAQILAALIHEVLYRIVFLGGNILFFSMYIEGTFQAKDLPLMDGSAVDWSRYTGHRIASAVIFLVIIGIIAVAVWKFGFKKVQSGLRVAMNLFGAIFLVTFFSLAIMNRGFEPKKNVVITKNHEFEFSGDQNLIMLVIDATSADVFKEVLETHPEYFEEFRDFTYYDNMLATYTQTLYSMPYMLSGDWYVYGQDDFDEYLTRAYSGSGFLQKLKDRNFRIDLYEDEMMRYREDAVQEFENIKIMGPGRLRLKKFLKLQTRMVGFRYVPFELKRFCMYYTWEFNNTRLENDVPIYSQDNLDFYRDLGDKECSLVNEKMFKLYHLEGAHEPFRYDADLNVIENGTHEKNVEAAIKLAEEFIQKLKDAGAYDNSAVIITADHGQSDEDIPEDRIHPVFFAKGIGESADRMRISEAPVSFEDLQEAYDKLLSGSSGRDIFEWKDDEKRERRCYVYSYPDELHNVEYILKGHAGDLDSLMRVTE